LTLLTVRVKLVLEQEVIMSHRDVIAKMKTLIEDIETEISMRKRVGEPHDYATERLKAARLALKHYMKAIGD
jgi:hypothetical protein